MYDGEWEDGQQHGKGKFIWSDGEMFYGSWVRGQEMPHAGDVSKKHQQHQIHVTTSQTSLHGDQSANDGDDDIKEDISSLRSSQGSSRKESKSTIQLDGDWTPVSTLRPPGSRAGPNRVRSITASPRILDLSSGWAKRPSK